MALLALLGLFALLAIALVIVNNCVQIAAMFSGNKLGIACLALFVVIFAVWVIESPDRIDQLKVLGVFLWEASKGLWAIVRTLFRTAFEV